MSHVEGKKRDDVTWVYHTAQSKKYHTDRDCRALKRADSVKRRPLDLLFDDREECGKCAGGES